MQSFESDNEIEQVIVVHCGNMQAVMILCWFYCGDLEVCTVLSV